LEFLLFEQDVVSVSKAIIVAVHKINCRIVYFGMKCHFKIAHNTQIYVSHPTFKIVIRTSISINQRIKKLVPEAGRLEPPNRNPAGEQGDIFYMGRNFR
jgi:hypothetical protein